MGTESFDCASQLLLEEFYDVEGLIDRTLGALIDQPKLTSISEVQTFVTSLRFKLVELQKLGLNFFEKTSGNVLLSKIIRDKLPKFFLIELNRKFAKAFPTLTDFLKHASGLIKMLNVSSNLAAKECTPNKQYSKPSKEVKDIVAESRFNKFHSIAPTRKTELYSSKKCKFCSSVNHRKIKCDRYPAYDDRKR